MKTIVLIFLIFCSIVCLAQNEQSERHHRGGREKIRAAHAAYITERLELTASQAEKFWPLYRAYTNKRRALREQFDDAKRNGESGQKLIELDLALKQQTLDLEKEYSRELLQIIPAEKILALRQAEIDFRRLVLRHVQHRK